MNALSKIGNLRRQIFLWIGLPVVAVAAVIFGAVDVVPAWQAKSGEGVSGTFTPAYQKCKRGSCTFTGTWKADDGSRTRTDVKLYDEPDSLTVNGSTKALDTGARNGVFATEGGSSYLLITGFAVLGIAAGIGWIFLVVRTIRRRTGARAPAPAPAA
jgi:hypothetical protein